MTTITKHDITWAIDDLGYLDLPEVVMTSCYHMGRWEFCLRRVVDGHFGEILLLGVIKA